MLPFKILINHLKTNTMQLNSSKVFNRLLTVFVTFTGKETFKLSILVSDTFDLGSYLFKVENLYGKEIISVAGEEHFAPICLN
jgi:hypothetical protein